MIKDITFLHPEFFWLFLVMPILIAWYYFSRKQQKASLTISNTNSFKNTTSIKTKMYPLLFVLRIIAVSSLIIALARPRTVDISAKSNSIKGIDIVMAIDVSGSMLAQDLKPNRLEALKKVASEFIKNRINDRIGLVVYAAESYTRTPVTSDKAIVQQSLKKIVYDSSILQDGTGIGVGLATAINRLKDSKAKSRIIILLTDGVNNAGTIDPRMAADIANQYGIKVYTIGIGTNGTAPFPVSKNAAGKFVFRNIPVEIDEKLMKEIAKTTQGTYFRATSNAKLQEIYNEINKLETTEIKEQKYFNYSEKFKPFVLFGLLLLAIEMIIKNTLFRSFI